MKHSGAPIIQVAVQAWRETFRALRAMASIFAATAALFVLLQLAKALAPEQDILWSQSRPQYFAVQFLDEIGYNMILTPLAVAIHRFVLLNEKTSSYRVVGRDRRSVFFFLYLTLVSLASEAVGTVDKVLRTRVNSDWSNAIILVASIVAFLIFAVRMTLLFPAIAVDAPRANVRNSFRDTRGHFWRITLVLLWASAPFVVLIAAVTWAVIHTGPHPRMPGGFKIFIGLVEPAFIAPSLAAASLLYRDYADRLTSPPPP